MRISRYQLHNIIQEELASLIQERGPGTAYDIQDKFKTLTDVGGKVSKGDYKGAAKDVSAQLMSTPATDVAGYIGDKAIEMGKKMAPGFKGMISRRGKVKKDRSGQKGTAWPGGVNPALQPTTDLAQTGTATRSRGYGGDISRASGTGAMPRPSTWLSKITPRFMGGNKRDDIEESRHYDDTFDEKKFFGTTFNEEYNKILEEEAYKLLQEGWFDPPWKRWEGDPNIKELPARQAPPKKKTAAELEAAAWTDEEEGPLDPETAAWNKAEEARARARSGELEGDPTTHLKPEYHEDTDDPRLRTPERMLQIQRIQPGSPHFRKLPSEMSRQVAEASLPRIQLCEVEDLDEIIKEELELLLQEQVRVVDPTPEEAEKERKEHEVLDRRAKEDDARVARTKRGWKDPEDKTHQKKDQRINKEEKDRGAQRMKAHDIMLAAIKAKEAADKAQEKARRSRAETAAADRRGASDSEIQARRKAAQEATHAAEEAQRAAAEKRQREDAARQAYTNMRTKDFARRKKERKQESGEGQYDPTPIDPETGLDFKMVKSTGYTYENRKNRRTGKVEKVAVPHVSRLPKHVTKHKFEGKHYFYNSKTGRIYRVPKRYR